MVGCSISYKFLSSFNVWSRGTNTFSKAHHCINTIVMNNGRQRLSFYSKITGLLSFAFHRSRLFVGQFFCHPRTLHFIVKSVRNVHQFATFISLRADGATLNVHRGFLRCWRDAQLSRKLLSSWWTGRRATVYNKMFSQGGGDIFFC